ncbi:GNAT family N-acetyltransferase [Roseococcus pinisoli]|uniref:GNAT family N-acetyltransferase n=1 Tax=Roseococcus pinisoli TaxID=2835040 RepID=A0ABS5Q9U3_9PROT|nr:GNAT family N-acetyltransferase [Roseococcus pinisoli]MBS7810203.1 GNAT family N-acetyltransferase [Roseococcus pinisoli]
MTGAAIRAAREGDLAAVQELYLHLNAEDPPADPALAGPAWARLLGSGLTTVLVAEVDGRLVASCTLVVIPNISRGARPYALIENVVTHAGHRRQGLGQAVLAAAQDLAWEAGCYKIMLASGSRQEATLRFYERAGFERGGKTFFQIRRP